jgi:hypothetical protein
MILHKIIVFFSRTHEFWEGYQSFHKIIERDGRICKIETTNLKSNPGKNEIRVKILVSSQELDTITSLSYPSSSCNHNAGISRGEDVITWLFVEVRIGWKIGASDLFPGIKAFQSVPGLWQLPNLCLMKVWKGSQIINTILWTR